MSLGTNADAAALAAGNATVISLLKGMLLRGAPVPDYTKAPTPVSLSASTNRNASALAAGLYLVKSDAHVYVRQGGSDVEATVDNNHWELEANVEYPLLVTGATNAYFAGILTTGTGVLKIQACL